MADLCPITELDPSMCAHCRKIPDPFAEPTSKRTGDGVPGPTFTARYRGKCACGNDFHPGDLIRADGSDGYLANCCITDDLTGDHL